MTENITLAMDTGYLPVPAWVERTFWDMAFIVFLMAHKIFHREVAIYRQQSILMMYATVVMALVAEFISPESKALQTFWDTTLYLPFYLYPVPVFHFQNENYTWELLYVSGHILMLFNVMLGNDASYYITILTSFSNAAVSESLQRLVFLLT